MRISCCTSRRVSPRPPATGMPPPPSSPPYPPPSRPAGRAPPPAPDLVPPALVPDGARLYPVGRLDQDSEGLVLLTNDGDWADRVLHPRNGVEREYALGLDRPLERDQVDALQKGIRLEEGVA